MNKKYEIWKNLIKALKQNNRPSVHGKLLRNLELENYYKESTMNFVLGLCTIDFECITKDYLLKKDGRLRNNAYLVSDNVFIAISFYCKEIYDIYGERDGVYYSGYLKQFDMFYENSYSYFQKELLSVYSNYSHYIKIDIKNFYKNISLKILKNKYPETNKLISLFNRLEMKEFPIIQECAGLSYIASCLYLEDMDQDIEKYIKTHVSDYCILRFSDDLYILLNDENQFINEQVIRKKIKEIFKKYNFELNDKFIIEETESLPAEMSMRLYDFFVGNEDFDIWEVIVDKKEVVQRIKSYIKGLRVS